MKKITLISTKDLEGYTNDDHLLVAELQKRGHSVQTKNWENLQDEGEDIFLVRTTWNYTKYIKNFFANLEKVQDRLFNPISLMKWNANKAYLAELSQKNSTVIPTEFPNCSVSLSNGMNRLGGNEFILKPLIAASADGLIRFNKGEAPPIHERMILQKFYPQITQGELSLVFFNGQFSYAVRKTPRSGDIRVQEEHGGIISCYTPTQEEIEASLNILELAPEASLYARVDHLPGAGLMELELIEPALYFQHSSTAAQAFADAIESKLKN